MFASSAAVEPDPVPVEDVIEAAVAEDTAAPSPPGMCGQQSQLSVRYTQCVKTHQSQAVLRESDSVNFVFPQSLKLHQNQLLWLLLRPMRLY